METYTFCAFLNNFPIHFHGFTNVFVSNGLKIFKNPDPSYTDFLKKSVLEYVQFRKENGKSLKTMVWE